MLESTRRTNITKKKKINKHKKQNTLKQNVWYITFAMTRILQFKIIKVATNLRGWRKIQPQKEKTQIQDEELYDLYKKDQFTPLFKDLLF